MMDWRATIGYRAGNTEDDIRRKFRDRVRAGHPDRGGSVSADRIDMNQLKRARNMALDYVRTSPVRTSPVRTSPSPTPSRQSSFTPSPSTTSRPSPSRQSSFTPSPSPSRPSPSRQSSFTPSPSPSRPSPSRQSSFTPSTTSRQSQPSPKHTRSKRQIQRDLKRRRKARDAERAAKNPYAWSPPTETRRASRSVEEKYGRYATYTPRPSLLERIVGSIFGRPQESWVDDFRKRASEKPRLYKRVTRRYGVIR